MSSALTSSLTSGSATPCLGLGGAGGRELLLQRGDLAVQQARRGLEVAVALGPLGLAAQLVDSLLELTDPVEAGLLALPARVEGVQLLGEVGQLAAQPRQPLLGRVVGLSGERHLLHLEPVDGALQLVDLDRARVDLHAQPRRGLVDQVDRLVGQEAAGDVAVGQRRRSDQRAVVDVAPCGAPRSLPFSPRRIAMVSSTDGSPTKHLLEAALERRVLLDVLAVLVQRRRADHAQFAAREHRLEHVAGVHRAVAGRAGADDGVQLVDEGDDLAAGVLDLGQDGLEPLLELAAVLRAGDHRAEVERDQLLAAQRLGHVAGDDALRQAFDDGGLADAGLADQDGVVLGAPRQHLDDAADLGVASDDRVDLALAGSGGQVVAVLLQRLEGALGIGRGDPAAAAHRRPARRPAQPG